MENRTLLRPLSSDTAILLQTIQDGPEQLFLSFAPVLLQPL